MTARTTEVEVQIMNHCGYGDDHRGAVTGQQMGNNCALLRPKLSPKNERMWKASCGHKGRHRPESKFYQFFFQKLHFFDYLMTPVTKLCNISVI